MTFSNFGNSLNKQLKHNWLLSRANRYSFVDAPKSIKENPTRFARYTMKGQIRDAEEFANTPLLAREEGRWKLNKLPVDSMERWENNPRLSNRVWRERPEEREAYINMQDILFDKFGL